MLAITNYIWINTELITKMAINGIISALSFSIAFRLMGVDV